jgi:hypothetical protein
MPLDNLNSKNKMKKAVQVKIYNVNPTGFKPTSIQVREIEPKVIYCRFLDPLPINEFKAMGFTVTYFNDVENILLQGQLTMDYTTSIWAEYLKNQDTPDIEFIHMKEI